MQGELYTVEPFGTHGDMEMDYDKLISENAGILPVQRRRRRAHRARIRSMPSVGETVRIFFGVGGPNFTSSFHVIGEIFDNVYTFGSITSPPITNVQTSRCRRAGRPSSTSSSTVPGLTCWSITPCRAPSAGWRIPDRRRSGGRRDHASRDGGSGAGGMKQGSGAAGHGRARCQGVTAVCSMHNPCTTHAHRMHEACTRRRAGVGS